MSKRNYASKRVTYVLMVILVFLWGLDFIAAKAAVDVTAPITLIFLKYFPAAIILVVIKLIRDRVFHLRKKDVLYFVACAIFGDVLYYASEYSAFTYLPVSIVSLVLAFVPAISIVTEIFVYKRLPSVKIVLGIVVSAIGVGLIVGADYRELLSGKLAGYLFIFAALISWNIYNFITERLSDNYDPVELSMYQIIGAVIFSAPYALTHMPAAADMMSVKFILAISFLAIVSGVIGFIVYVNSVAVIGVTPSALFSNMMPVTTTFFGWLMLGERITALQLVGGAVVIAAGAAVIYLKDKNPGRYFGKKAHISENEGGANGN
ncbi:MAG: DMT family transporter [Clostridiales Family XIII bacterium]|jgi:drug/metabolite transporter (DMT)-like permease|nr:DMT family transporter [Clostridiales Family XIII bacterium]